VDGITYLLGIQIIEVQLPLVVARKEKAREFIDGG